MIKIVSGRSIPVGSTVALANLCNQLNARGHGCVFHGPDRWHLDKCRSALLSDFRPEGGDIVIAHGLRLRSAADLYDVNNPSVSGAGYGLLSVLKQDVFGYLRSRRRPETFRLLLSFSGSDPARTGRAAWSTFHKIHFSCEAQKDRASAGSSHFVCPDFLHDLKKPDRRPQKVAGVIGCVRPENALERSIEKALLDGMESVIVYGYLLDPVYFHSHVLPLAKRYPGRIRFAGFLDDPQKMYNSISDVYRCAAKPWSAVKRECALTDTRYLGPDAPGDEEAAGNDAIYAVWKRELEL